jgi:hypothetical protein
MSDRTRPVEVEIQRGVGKWRPGPVLDRRNFNIPLIASYDWWKYRLRSVHWLKLSEEGETERTLDRIRPVESGKERELGTWRTGLVLQHSTDTDSVMSLVETQNTIFSLAQIDRGRRDC